MTKSQHPKGARFSIIAFYLVGTLCILQFYAYFSNSLETVSADWFTNGQRDSESFVISRLILANLHSHDNYIFMDMVDESIDDRDLPWNRRVQKRYDLYINPPLKLSETYTVNWNERRLKPPPGGWANVDKPPGLRGQPQYFSQVGLQAVGLTMVDHLLPIDRALKLKLFYALAVLVLVAEFGLMFLWSSREFGLWPALLTHSVLILNPWLTVFARNLFWVPFVWFLPLVAMLVLGAIDEKRTVSISWFATLAFLASLAKFCTGYEFASCVLITLTIPLVYFAIKNRWGKVLFLKRFASVAIAGIGGFASAMAINILLISDVYDITMPEATRKLLFRAFEWSGNPYDFSVFFSYFVGDTYPPRRQFGGYSSMLDIGFLTTERISVGIIFFVVIFFITTISFWSQRLFYKQQMMLPDQEDRKLLALNVAGVLSFMSSISWFLLYTGHSAFHHHVNYILWCLSFLIFGNLYTISYLSEIIRIRLRNPKSAN